MIRHCKPSDKHTIYTIVNEAAKAYENVIPADRYHQPYMSMPELAQEMKRVTFFGWADERKLVGIMGIEPVRDVTLIRHAYVLPEHQKQGIGGKLLEYLKDKVSTSQLLVGTWADAYWAVELYQKHGFTLMSNKDELLHTYWDIPERQVETSVVLGIAIK